MGERGRRGKGDGSVYRLPDGRWQGAIDLGWADGSRKRKRITRDTKTAVIRDLRKLAGEVQGGLLISGQSPRLDEWMQTYLSEVAASRVRPRTLQSYESAARLHINPRIGRIRLDRLEPQHVAQFYCDLSSSLSPNSIRRLHALLRRSLTVAVRWGLLKSNPVILVDPPPVARKEITPLNAAEARRFLAAARTHRIYARWVVGLSLGLRQGEALGLQWSDINLDTGLVEIRNALQRQPDGVLQLVETKTARSRRTLPLPTPVSSALRAHRGHQEQEQRIAGSLWARSNFVFTTALGNPVSPRNDYQAFRRLLERAGLRQIRLHDLRHTTASLLLAQGVAPRVVMEILGHSQISITMNTYSHVPHELNRAATDGIGETLWPSA